MATITNTLPSIFVSVLVLLPAVGRPGRVLTSGEDRCHSKKAVLAPFTNKRKVECKTRLTATCAKRGRQRKEIAARGEGVGCEQDRHRAFPTVFVGRRPGEDER